MDSPCGQSWLDRVPCQSMAPRPLCRPILPAPGGENQAGEGDAPLEGVGEERVIAVHADAPPAGERRHDRLRPRVDRRGEPDRIDIAQLALARGVVPRVPAAGAAVAEEVL